MLFRLEKLQKNMEFSDLMMRDVMKEVLEVKRAVWVVREDDAEYWIEECAACVCALRRFFQQAKVEKVGWVGPLRAKARADGDEAVAPEPRAERDARADAEEAAFWDSLIVELDKDEDDVSPERDAKVRRLQ